MFYSMKLFKRLGLFCAVFAFVSGSFRVFTCDSGQSSPLELIDSEYGNSSDTEGVINNHRYVDLGLSVLWATSNVGAKIPSDLGNYYAWGETCTKERYDEENSRTFGKGIRDFSGNPRYDAARVAWGAPWRMPTKVEMFELVNKCTWKWLPSIGGYKITGPNGKSIYLPAAGSRHGDILIDKRVYGGYWTSSPYPRSKDRAYYMYINIAQYEVGEHRRSIGLPIRPVSDKI